VPDHGVHPDPPADLDGQRPLLREVRRTWARIHRRDRDPLHFGRSRVHRFDDPVAHFGVLYLAEDAYGAFIEAFGGQLDVRTVTTAALAARALSSIEASRGLRLIDLASSGGLARLGADGRLTSGIAAVSQRWARALWRHPVGADGIYYRLRHDIARCGCAVFDRARDALGATSIGTLGDPRHRTMLGDILDTYGFSLLTD
jgi:hypothetical protein